jgi:hypothetical protein
MKLTLPLQGLRELGSFRKGTAGQRFSTSSEWQPVCCDQFRSMLRELIYMVGMVGLIIAALLLLNAYQFI